VGFYSAIEMFLSEQKTRQIQGKIGISRYTHLAERLQTVKRFVVDAPLKTFDRNKLKPIIDHWLNRPISKSTGKKLSANYVKFIIDDLEIFFRWAYEDAQIWDGFKFWQKLFSVEGSDLLTENERREAKKGKKFFTIDELTTLYANATPRMRLFICLSLNCGFGQTEIATLHKDDLKLNDGFARKYIDDANPDKGTVATEPSYIERNRHKTGVQGRWRLWEETAEQLRIITGKFAHIKEDDMRLVEAKFNDEIKDRRTEKPTDTDGLAIVTAKGFPLVHYSDNGQKTDSIRLAWAKLLDHANVRGKIRNGLSFYSLRRTALQTVRQFKGLETSKVFAAHATIDASGKQSVNEAHYTERTAADFAAVDEAIVAMEKMLQPMLKSARNVYVGLGVKTPKPKRKRRSKKEMAAAL
jgi:hypothetical protein